MKLRVDKYVLDERGEPRPEPNVYAWGRWMETADRRVARDEIEGRGEVGPAVVSTVFLGLDHAFGDGPPVLWETLIRDGPLDGMMRRYASREDALAGHAELVGRARSAAQVDAAIIASRRDLEARGEVGGTPADRLEGLAGLRRLAAHLDGGGGGESN